jgi:hypothetical protein
MRSRGRLKSGWEAAFLNAVSCGLADPRDSQVSI